MLKKILIVCLGLQFSEFISVSQIPCQCFNQTFEFEYAYICDKPCSVSNIPGHSINYVGDIQNQYGKIFSVYTYRVCTQDPCISGFPNSYPLEYPTGYWPARLSIEDCELTDLHDINGPCTEFNIENAVICMNDACERYNNICSHVDATKYAVITRGLAPQTGVFTVQVSSDPNLFKPTTLAVTDISKHGYATFDAQTGDVQTFTWTRAIPNTPLDSKNYDGLFFRSDNKSLGWVYSTTCPCTACAKYKECYYFCKVFQHELGHVLGLQHLIINCPSTNLDPNSTMNADESYPPAECHMDFTCDDLCYYCRRNCPTHCNLVTGLLPDQKPQNSFGIYLYPQPSKRCASIQVYGQPKGLTSLYVYDNAGRERYHFSMNERQTICKIENILPGVYIVDAIDENGQKVTKKMIITY